MNELNQGNNYGQTHLVYRSCSNKLQRLNPTITITILGTGPFQAFKEPDFLLQPIASTRDEVN